MADACDEITRQMDRYGIDSGEITRWDGAVLRFTLTK